MLRTPSGRGAGSAYVRRAANHSRARRSRVASAFCFRAPRAAGAEIRGPQSGHRPLSSLVRSHPHGAQPPAGATFRNRQASAQLAPSQTSSPSATHKMGPSLSCAFMTIRPALRAPTALVSPIDRYGHPDVLNVLAVYQNDEEMPLCVRWLTGSEHAPDRGCRGRSPCSRRACRAGPASSYRRIVRGRGAQGPGIERTPTALRDWKSFRTRDWRALSGLPVAHSITPPEGLSRHAGFQSTYCFVSSATALPTLPSPRTTVYSTSI
jgi:hypothetical protein